MNVYRCNHCGKTVRRDSDKRWIKSICEATGRTTRLWRLSTPPADPEDGGESNE